MAMANRGCVVLLLLRTITPTCGLAPETGTACADAHTRLFASLSFGGCGQMSWRARASIHSSTILGRADVGRELLPIHADEAGGWLPPVIAATL